MAARNAAPKKPAGPPDPGEFVYTAPNGGTITLPPMSKALNPSELRKLRRESPLGILYYVLERDLDAVELAEVDTVLESMSLADDVPDLVEQWQDHSRVSLGESSA